MEQVIIQVIVSLTGLIGTLVGVIVILNKRGLESKSQHNNYDKIINESVNERKEHCEERLEKCQFEFKDIAVTNAKISTQLEAIGNDLVELKRLVKNGNK